MPPGCLNIDSGFICPLLLRNFLGEDLNAKETLGFLESKIEVIKSSHAPHLKKNWL